MRNVLYIGNNLNNKQSNISAIGVLGPLLEGSGFNLYYASSKTHKFARLMDMIWSCFKLCRQVDVVLIDTYSTQNFYYALLVSQLCRLLRLPYMPILHGGNLESRLKQNPRLSRLIFNHSKVNIAPSFFIKAIFESYCYSQIVYIPNTITIGNYQFKERLIPPIKMLWVRSFSNIYNPQLAVRVLKQLHDKGHEATLCMVGPDTGDNSFQETQQLAKDLSVPVIFSGKLTKSEWITLAKNYNVFINTTNFDNMPVSVIEAMALGLPVVSTDVGGMPYLIENQYDGVLVPSNQAEAFASAIERLVANPEQTQTMAIKARRKVEQFDWEVVKCSWFEVLDDYGK